MQTLDKSYIFEYFQLYKIEPLPLLATYPICDESHQKLDFTEMRGFQQHFPVILGTTSRPRSPQISPAKSPVNNLAPSTAVTAKSPSKSPAKSPARFQFHQRFTQAFFIQKSLRSFSLLTF